jgi:hypothetical protein
MTMLKQSNLATLPEGKYCDGDYLWLAVKGGSRVWVMRGPAVNGKRREIGLGSVKTVPLALARKRRDALLKQWHEIAPPVEGDEAWAKRKIAQLGRSPG